MAQLMVFVVYPRHEACDKLGKLVELGRPYSRQRLDELVKKHLPCAEKVAGQYFLRDPEIAYLATKIEVKKRRKH